MAGVGMGPSKRISTPAAERPACNADSNIFPEMRVSLPMRTLPGPPWVRASTLPAAPPSFRTNSALLGDSPTLPRMPSVPKYRRCVASIIAASPSAFTNAVRSYRAHLRALHSGRGAYRRRHLLRMHGSRLLVGAYHRRPLRDRQRGERNTTIHAPILRHLQHRTDQRFARCADQHGRTERGELGEVFHLGEIV